MNATPHYQLTVLYSTSSSQKAINLKFTEALKKLDTHPFQRSCGDLCEFTVFSSAKVATIEMIDFHFDDPSNDAIRWGRMKQPQTGEHYSHYNKSLLLVRYSLDPLAFPLMLLIKTEQQVRSGASKINTIIDRTSRSLSVIQITVKKGIKIAREGETRNGHDAVWSLVRDSREDRAKRYLHRLTIKISGLYDLSSRRIPGQFVVPGHPHLDNEATG